MSMTVEQARGAMRMATADAKAELFAELGDVEITPEVLRAFERRASLKFRIYAKAHGVRCDPSVEAKLEGGQLLAHYDLRGIEIAGAATEVIHA